MEDNTPEIDLDVELSKKTSNEVDPKSTEIKMDPATTETVSPESIPPVEQEESFESPHVETPSGSTEPNDGKVKMSFGDSAESIVSGLDFLQRMILSWIYRYKMNSRFTDAQKVAIVKAEENLANGTKSEKEIDDDTAVALVKWRILQERVARLPFTDKEFEKLKTPFELYCKKNNVRVGPEVGMIIAAVDVIGGRIADAVMD